MRAMTLKVQTPRNYKGGECFYLGEAVSVFRRVDASGTVANLEPAR